MKHHFIALLLLLSATIAFSGEHTLISGNMDHGGFGGPVVKISRIGPNSANAILVGGQGGWILGHKFILGGGGYGLTDNVRADWIENRVYDGQSQPYYLDFGYGGLLLGFVQNSDDLIHYEIYGLFGGGGVGYRQKGGMDSHMDSDALFIAEPGINIMINVTPFFRIGAGASYRYVNGVDDAVLTDENLSGISGQIVFKFGAF